MRTVKWNAFLSGLCGAAAFLGVVATGARADVTIEQGASILVFPKVQADTSRDTTIQIANTGNSMVHAKCYYVNAAGGLWQETDFSIWLTKQQPTHWVVSRGRRVAFEPFGSDGAGFDPGLVPPVVVGFEGELKCIEVTESEEPYSGNHLKGEATLSSTVDVLLPSTAGDVSKYNAIGFLGNPDVTPTNPLQLNDSMYNACPARLDLDFFATGSEDPVLADLSDRLEEGAIESFTATELTLVPCSEDFETQTPTSVTIQFVVYNEYEERFSASTTVACYLNVELTDIDSPTTIERSIFSEPVLGSLVGHAEIMPVPNTDGVTKGVIGITERFVVASTTGITVASTTGITPRAEDNMSAAYNLHIAGTLVSDSNPNPDEIRLTEKE